MFQSMSVRYFLFFLCISLHACKARDLGTFDKKLEKKPDFFPKNYEKNGFDSSPKQLGLMIKGDNGTKTGLVANTEKPKERRSANLRVDKVMGKASVSWRVPHKKTTGEKNPGFSLDYEPPKTHPPSHN